MSKGKTLTFRILKVIGIILSAIPFIVSIACLIVEFAFNLIRTVADKMIEVFMFPSIKYYYKHQYGKEITLEQLRGRE